MLTQAFRREARRDGEIRDMPPLYDPALRRDTPLARKLIARIGRDGPIDTYDYMDACLNDPEYGYYRTRIAIGRDGDFITAPEISQVFGELIGLWCAVVWQQMGSPQKVNLIELGAGRGTLLADALRALRLVPGFRAAVSVHVLDSNPVLIDLQRKALAKCGVPVAWYGTTDALPSDAASIWVGNEFLDAVPAHQRERRKGLWYVRAIGLDSAGRLAFVTEPNIEFAFSDDDVPGLPIQHSALNGDIRAMATYEFHILHAMRVRSALAPSAALFIDYGYAGAGRIDTLQAVRGHRPEHVLTSPGEADLSCLVSFDELAHDARLPLNPRYSCGINFTTDGPVTQSEFLGQLGIVERASKLMAANPAKANEIEMGVARLMAPQGMGTRFLALGVRSPGLPPLPGFAMPK